MSFELYSSKEFHWHYVMETFRYAMLAVLLFWRLRARVILYIDYHKCTAKLKLLSLVIMLKKKRENKRLINCNFNQSSGSYPKVVTGLKSGWIS